MTDINTFAEDTQPGNDTATHVNNRKKMVSLRSARVLTLMQEVSSFYHEHGTYPLATDFAAEHGETLSAANEAIRRVRITNGHLGGSNKYNKALDIAREMMKATNTIPTIKDLCFQANVSAQIARSAQVTLRRENPEVKTVSGKQAVIKVTDAKTSRQAEVISLYERMQAAFPDFSSGHMSAVSAFAGVTRQRVEQIIKGKASTKAQPGS